MARAKKKTHEFDYIGATVKVGGEAPLPDNVEFEHGDEVYVVSRAEIKEVAFPEDKDGNILRVHKARLTQAFLVDPEDAENVIAAQRERVSGQGNIIAEINRTKETEVDDDDDDFA